MASGGAAGGGSGEEAGPVVFEIHGYSGCGFYYDACSVAQDLERTLGSNRVVARCEVLPRSEFKSWLAQRQGLAAGVPSQHRTRPACFKN